MFLGSGAFAVPSLAALLDAGHDVAALVTQPDREKGRGRALAAPPTKTLAQARGVPVLQPPRIKEAGVVEALRALRPEVQVVVAYGQILPRAVIDIPPLGTVNVHSSLLPRYRGAAPIHWAIVDGARETGVTTMLIDEGLDTGPLLMARSAAIGEEETTPELEARLAALGAAVLLETLEGLARGTLEPRPQDHSRATVARRLEKDDARMDWTRPAEEIARRVRGLQPWPGTATRLAGRELKVLRARPEPAPPAGTPPGTVIAADGDGIVVAAGGGTRLRLLEVQPESRRAMSAAAFAAGARLEPGVRLT
ncbi:MAG TPA: methionyl-tRNA formyltransferase [Vicinamibacteria bacterium]|nr:methionyl-tRNA formyltransferase [Vicinamibacteria bacterium]